MGLRTGMATLHAQWLRSQPDSDGKTVALLAMDMVGKLAWANTLVAPDQIAPGGSLNTNKIGCICYQAPLLFAYMAGLIGKSKLDGFTKLKTNDAAIDKIYTDISSHVSIYQPGGGALIPLGAMVYHGRPGNPAAHVTMYVGRDLVVSTWAADNAYAQIAETRGRESAEAKICMKQIEDLMAKGHPAATLVVPITSFSAIGDQAHHTTVRYTTQPIWDLI